MEMQKELVSVIVPIYNVGKYLDKCISSIVSQTYTNIEIILVNDGSTDNSLQICEAWSGRDNRILVINQENRGLSGARNTGISYSKGNWFVFVDSDDWVLPQYVELLLNAAIDSNAELAVCNYYNYMESTQNIIINRQQIDGQLLENMADKGLYMLCGHVWMCSKIYRRDFYQRCVGQLPDMKYEDFAILPQVIFGAEKIICISDALYYYRSDRPDSIMNSSQSLVDFEKALDYSFEIVRGKHQYTTLRKYITLLGIRQSRFILQCAERGNIHVAEFRARIEHVFSQNVNDWRRYLPCTPIIFGSFNLRWIVKRLVLGAEDAEDYFGFTCLISQFMGEKLEAKVQCNNPFRSRMLQQDFGQELKSRITDGNADYIFIDFMNDVNNPIVIIDKNQIITASEAYCEFEQGKENSERCYNYSDKKYMNYWYEACDRIVIELKNSDLKVVLIKNRFAKVYFENGEMIPFDNCHELEQKNKMLDVMEQYFIQCMPDVQIISMTPDLLYNNEVRYDKSPEYLNSQAYNYAAYKWFEMMIKDESI